MTTTFTGEVRIPGSIENGLPSTITLDSQTLILTAGGTELGRWNRNDLKLRREPDGSFHLTLGREVVLFNPDSPLEFAILSGMPGAGTAPTPAPAAPEAPAAPAPAETLAEQPAAPAALPPAVPAAPAPAAIPSTDAVPAAPPPSPAAPPPAVPQPSLSTPPPASPQPAVQPPAAVPPAVAAPPAPAGAPAPAVETPVVPPAAVPPATTAPPQAAPQPSAPAAAAPPTPPAAATAPLDFHLEENPAPEATSQAPPQPTAPPVPPSPARAAGTSTDFWDGFYAEEHEAATMPPVPQPASEQHDLADEAVQAAAGFQLQDDLDDAPSEAEPRVGGFGSGLFTDDDNNPVYPPAFGRDESDGSEDRSWSYYDEDDGSGDRAWSYDEDPAEQETEESPAFKSPAANREDLVDSSLGSRIAGITSWRPSLPSFSFGSSELGMRARDALSVLDAILEENGTEDIPKSFIIGLGGFAALLGVVALLIVLFG